MSNFVSRCRIGLVSAFLGLIALLGTAPLAHAQANGFGTCAQVGNTRAAVRNDARLGSWYNTQRGGSGWDLSGLSNDGVNVSGSAAVVYWWTFNVNGIPEWYSGSGAYPVPGAAQWSTDLYRVVKVGANPAVVSKVGNATFTFSPGGNAKRTEVTWLLFGSTSAQAEAGRASVTGTSQDQVQTECLTSSVDAVSPDMGAPAPTAAFAGAWSMDPASAFARHGFVTEFSRATRDWNGDGRLDEDREIENGIVTFYGATSGSPRWGVVQRESDAVRAQTGVRSFELREVVHGVCPWCAPLGFQPQHVIGSYQHQFLSAGSAQVSATVTSIVGAGKPGAENVSFNPANEPMTRATSGRYDVGGPAEEPAPLVATDPGIDVVSDAVGAMNGEFRVDESGAATYSIALMTVPGAGGFAPKMGLSYSSAAGDGTLGVGWSISGLSAISRCRKAAEFGDQPNAAGVYPPVSLVDGQDVFCIDGQRLVQVHSGSESVDGTTLNFFEYRTELDNSSRIRGYRTTAALDPTWFAVWASDGSYREYGRDANAENSRLSANTNGVQRAGISVNWSINKLRDAGKNTIRFVYGADQNNGEQWISEVRYTGNDNTGLTPESAGHKIVFDYNTTSPALDIGFTAGSKSQRSRWLSMVRSTSGATEVRRYTVTYLPMLGVTNYRRQIGSIQECRVNGSTVCYPATQFTPSTGSSQLGALHSSTPPPSTFSGPALPKITDQKFGDVNGDGRTDMVWLKQLNGYNEQITVRFTTSTGSGISFADDVGVPMHDDFDNDRGWHLLDYNADGKDDLLVSEYLNGVNGTAEWRLHYSEGTRFSPTSISLGIPASPDAEAVLADMNGDGLPDLVTGAPNNTLQVRYLLKNPTYASGIPFIFSSAASVQFVNANGTPGAFVLRPRKIDHDQFDVFDANGDGRADLVMKGELASSATTGGEFFADTDPTTGDNDSEQSIDPPEPMATNGIPDYWMIFTSDSISPSTLTFRLLKLWQATELGAVASADDDKFRVTDINGDGLADAFYRRANLSNQWAYELNLGNGSFGPATCALGGTVATGCTTTRTDRLLKLQDFNGDGRADVWDTGAAPIAGSSDNYPYGAHLWSGTGFATVPVATGAIAYNTSAGTSLTPRLTAFPDLDGDGAPDQLTIEWGSTSGDYRYHRSSTPYLPRNLVTEISNGFGAKTIIDYAPMSFASVYRRDYGSVYNSVGRGSAVQDVVAPTYVVEGVDSCAPREGQVDCIGSVAGARSGFSRVEYGYQGAKVQGGGRGFQGFAVLETFDNQRSILTRTEYFQDFPLTSRARRTRAWHLPNAARADVCGSPYAAGCFEPAEMCRSNKGNRPIPCSRDVYGVMFKTDSDIGNVRSLLSESADTLEWSFLTAAPGGANDNQWTTANAALPVSTPTAVRVLMASTTKTSIDPGSNSPLPIAAKILNLETTTFEAAANGKRYDDYGNPLRVVTDKLNGVGVRFSRVVGENVYANYPATWQLGRLTSATASTTRDGPTKVRTSNFEYDPTTKLLKVERVMSGAGAYNELNTFYQYDSFGNAIKTATCSVEFNTEAACLNTAANSIASQPSTDSMIRRYARSVFDSQGRFADQSVELFYSSAASSREVVTATSADRNIFGDPQTLTTAAGLSSSVRYGILGRKYFEASNTGASSATSYRSCTAVPCPVGAKYREQAMVAGGPKRWMYFDALSREILTVKETFESGNYVAVRKHYDFLGRVRKVSERYFAVGPLVSGVETAASGSIYWTTTSYDILDRPTAIQHPNNTSTTMSYNVLVTTIVNPKSQTRVEEKNPLGEVIRVTDAANNSVCFSYDAFGSVQAAGKSTAPNCASVTATQTMSFDDLGRKTSMVDVDMGIWSYTYNAAGELLKQLSPRGGCTVNKYDVRGRLYSRADYTSAACTGIEHNASWLFDSLKPGLVTSEVAGNSYAGVISSQQSRAYTYDAYGRVRSVATVVDGLSVSDRSTYDQYGRAFQQFDASGEGVMNQYNARGYLYRVRDAVPGTYGEVYYEIRAMDAREKVTKDWRGVNVQTVAGVADQSVYGLETRHGYDPSTGWLTSIQAGESNYGNSYIQNWTYAYDAIGNVEQRHDWRSDGLYHEIGVYDALNRIDLLSRYQGSALTPRGTEDYSYDPWGNLLTKPGIGGTMQYGQTNAACSARPTAGPHAVTSANGVSYCYDQAGNQVSGSDGRSVVYTVADQVRGISLTSTSKSTRYYYGAGRGRYKRQDYPSAGYLGTPKTTVYLGNVEHITNGSGVVEIKRYIAGVAVISTRSDGADKKEFVFTDHLGSTDAITDRFGNVDTLCVDDNVGYRCRSGQRMSFDAFGLRRKVADNSSTAWSQLDLATRSNFSIGKTAHGFTGHEMADGVDLVHMNGRMYDPELGRFIQADPFVQDPYNTQSLNRYSYVMNNPLTATDPTGYFTFAQALRVVVAVAITVYSGGTAAGAAWGFYGGAVTAGQSLAWATVGGALAGGIQSGTLKGALIGAFSGAVFHGIGASSSLGTGERVFAHAVTGGTISVLQGGKFGHGFVSAGLSKVIGPKIDTGSTFGDGALQAVVGGSISELTGGKFANGAVTSAMQFSFNQLYQWRNNQPYERMEKVGKTEFSLKWRHAGTGVSTSAKYNENGTFTGINPVEYSGLIGGSVGLSTEAEWSWDASVEVPILKLGDYFEASCGVEYGSDGFYATFSEQLCLGPLCGVMKYKYQPTKDTAALIRNTGRIDRNVAKAEAPTRTQEDGRWSFWSGVPRGLRELFNRTP